MIRSQFSSHEPISGTGNVYALPTIDGGGSIAQSESLNDRKIRRRFDQLCAMPVGWDGYRSGQVLFSTANFAHEIVRNITRLSSIEPVISPTSGGAVQAEWSFEHGLVELLFHSPLNVSAYMEFQGGSDERELRSDFTVVENFILDRLANTIVDHAATA
jgi:hypothetical protein